MARGQRLSSDWIPGRKILNGAYEVERLLGEGGKGKVFLVRDLGIANTRFAVKRTLRLDPHSRQAFLDELQTWIDLPEHPHVAACRFFRVENDEVLIFADYIEGGSLFSWIGNEKTRTVETILDYAIQFAWGLHAAHELGLVHQDVKPDNALVTGDGVVKVSDFGIAGARSVAEGSVDLGDVTVTIHGATVAYRSPEQAARKRLTRQTDIWSWGVSVLEMFTGTTSRPGEQAGQELNDYLKRRPDNGQVAIPNVVADVLSQCFQEDPEDRWPTMFEAAQALSEAFRQLCGHAYRRAIPEFVRRGERGAAAAERRNSIGEEWEPAAIVLARALRAGGDDISKAARLLKPAGVTRRGQGAAELSGYDEAKRIYTDLIERQGGNELCEELAGLCRNKALLHHHLGDIGAATSEYDQAIAIYESLVNREGRSEICDHLAAAYVGKGTMLRHQGNLSGAISEYDRAIAIRERLVSQEGRSEIRQDLALAYGNKGAALANQGNLSGAVSECDRAIAIYERLVNQEGRSEICDELAAAYEGKGTMLRHQGNLSGAISEYDRAIAIRERLVNQEGRSELANNLAATYMNKGNALVQGNINSAVREYDRAIAIRERLVNQEGRAEIRQYLATTYMNKGTALRNQGNLSGAVSDYDRAIAIYERLVNQEGHSEIRHELAAAYGNKGNALQIQGNLSGAISEYDRAIAIRERLVSQEGRSEIRQDLALAYRNKGAALVTQGNVSGAVRECDRAIAIYERLVNQEGRVDIRKDLAGVYVSRAVLCLRAGERAETHGELDRAFEIINSLSNRSTAAVREQLLQSAHEIEQATKEGKLHMLIESRLETSLTDEEDRAIRQIADIAERGWPALGKTFQVKSIELVERTFGGSRDEIVMEFASDGCKLIVPRGALESAVAKLR